MIGAFPLPALSKDQPPAFVSVGGCRQWLSQLPMANAAQAQPLLLAELNLLNRYALAPRERLQILELLRDPISFVQGECTRKFAGRPLPLAVHEQAAFEANRTLWQALCTGYQHCLAACLDGDAETNSQSSFIAQRALATLGAEQLDLYLACWETGPSFWRRVHAIFSAAAEMGVAEEPVTDALASRSSPSSVRSTYVHLLLVHAASPYELSARNLGHAWRWLRRWSRKVALQPTLPADCKLPPLTVDLSGDRPAQVGTSGQGNTRWIVVDDLARSLRKRVALLERGAEPAALNLGEDVPPGAEALLRHLYEHCCKGVVQRQQSRRGGSGSCALISGGEPLFTHLTGKRFEPTASQVMRLTRQQHEELATLGRIITRTEPAPGEADVPVIDWQILDEHGAGLRLGVAAAPSPQRVGVACLVGVKPPGSAIFLLASTRWLMVTQEGQLQIGVQLMPGVPTAVELRPQGPRVPGDRPRAGFLLPPIPSLQQPATMVCPAGWFRPDRVIEVSGEDSQRLRMIRVIEHGYDYERAEYVAL